MRTFLRVFGAMGYGSSRQIAARRALALYEQLCTGRAEEDRQFWAEGVDDFFVLPSYMSSSLPFNETVDDPFSSEQQSAISLQRFSLGSL
jgi:hypothetical protein